TVQPAAELRVHLVSAGSAHREPLIVAVGPSGELSWTKDRPVAGIVPPVTQLALTTGLQDGVVLFLYDAPTHVVGARMWDGAGGLLADFHVLSADDCSHLSALYWPPHGWVVAASWEGATRAQLLKEDGSYGWSREGI